MSNVDSKGRPVGLDRVVVTTSLRFPRPVLIQLKKIAIDRNQSVQEMIEHGLSLLLERDGQVVDGLRAGE